MEVPDFIELDDTKLAELDDAELADYEQAKGEHEESKLAEQQKLEKAKQKDSTAQGLINSYQKKIDNGDITVDEAPKWMSNDLKPKEEVKDDASLKEQIKAEMKDEIKYDNLYEDVPEDKQDEVDLIVEKEQELGRSKSQALKYAMFELNIRKEENQYKTFPQIRNKLKAKVKTDPTEDYYMNNLPKGYK